MKSLILVATALYLFAAQVEAKESKVTGFYTAGQEIQNPLTSSISPLNNEIPPDLQPIRYATAESHVYKYTITVGKDGTVNMTVPVKVCSARISAPVYDLRYVTNGRIALTAFNCPTELYGNEVLFGMVSTITLTLDRGFERKNFYGFSGYDEGAVGQSKYRSGNMNFSTKTLGLPDAKFQLYPALDSVQAPGQTVEVLFSTMEIEDPA